MDAWKSNRAVEIWIELAMVAAMTQPTLPLPIPDGDAWADSDSPTNFPYGISTPIFAWSFQRVRARTALK
jgi:hypothetical protein